LVGSTAGAAGSVVALAQALSTRLVIITITNRIWNLRDIFLLPPEVF